MKAKLPTMDSTDENPLTQDSLPRLVYFYRELTINSQVETDERTIAVGRFDFHCFLHRSLGLP